MARNFEINAQHKEDALNLIERFSKFGATRQGGVNRLAASIEDKGARDYLIHWFEQNGFITLIDEVGNIFGVLEFEGSQSQSSFYCGSHLDSQPHGGRFDGTVGVAIACIAALALKELIDRNEFQTSYKRFVVACWTSEEGARFQPSLLGSRVFSGNMEVTEAWNVSDANGISLKSALSDIDYIGSDKPPFPDHYLEVHIEQGVELEQAGVSIGIVNAAWGARKITLSCKGKADHTGPTPMRDRKDALLAASKIVIKVNEIANAQDKTLHSSVGRIEVSPNSPNTVADDALIWIEFRSADEAILDQAENSLKAACKEITTDTNCVIAEENREVRPVVFFDDWALKQATFTLENAGISSLSMTTISGHDAIQLQSICPSTLMFVPSKDGISHAPDEFTADEDIERGLEATLATITALTSSSHAQNLGENALV